MPLQLSMQSSQSSVEHTKDHYQGPTCSDITLHIHCSKSTTISLEAIKGFPLMNMLPLVTYTNFIPNTITLDAIFIGNRMGGAIELQPHLILRGSIGF